ncbi:alanine--glyoxylate aminotransferase family protein [Brucella pituitosa]|uniref:pyridoxamine--pyruvate transaminase n=1 Tax=Brucella pituitosa TaxID=571256 RepID=UPI000C280565|nr:alanine--glyoxylate aminotransferase family protein [Brucella pituitosa]MCK4205414.1 alanine--glyoxylate aminotransferase family protein [Brucella pituitosa]PJO49082.1 aminotransferase [Brucella pituitosa]PRA84915.1 aminotransferase [Ochrobactrum sp. MYb29]
MSHTSLGKIADPIFTLTTGPVDAYPAVLQALSRPVLYDYDPAFLAFYESVNAKVQRAFHTKTPPVILQGEPVLGLEAAAASLITRNDVVLNLVSGVYGKGFGYWAARYAKEVVELAVPYNEVLSADAVADFLKKRPDVAVVSICHHDTPSGTVNPVAEIGAVVRAAGKLFIVDSVSAFGGMDVLPETSFADIFVTGPNKCLGCPPGLTLLHVSEAAWEKMAANPDAPRASILSIVDWKEAHRADRPFPFTPSVSEINALDAALDIYLDEGEANVWARHALTAKACRAGVQAAGLKLWAAREEIASATCTAVSIPEGIDEAKLRASIRDVYGVVFSSGRGETLGKLTRIGHMGPTARPPYSLISVAAIAGGLKAAGVKGIDVGAGVAAAMAVIEAARD